MGISDQRSIAVRVRAARLSKGLSQEGLARLAEVSTKTVCRLEQADRVVSAPLLNRIAITLGETVDWLLNGPSSAAPAKRRRKPAVGGA